MNEMDMVKRFCAEPPSPSPESLEAARAMLMTTIQATSGIGRPPASRRGWPLRAMAIPRRTHFAAVVASALIILAGILLAVGIGAGHRPGRQVGIGLDAAIVLHRAAAAALAQPVARNDQFIYTEVRATSGPSGRSEIIRTWLSVNGSRTGAQRQNPCPTALHVLPTCLYAAPRFRGSPATVSYGWLRRLPTRPRRLLAYLESNNGCSRLPRSPLTTGISRSDAAFSEIYIILNSIYMLPPKLGAALFNATAMISGTTVQLNAADYAGGRGIAVSIAPHVGQLGQQTKYELIFDRSDYRFVGSQVMSGGASGWTVLLASKLINLRLVNSAPRGFTMSDKRLLTGPSTSAPYLSWPPPYTWGPAECIFGSLGFR